MEYESNCWLKIHWMDTVKCVEGCGFDPGWGSLEFFMDIIRLATLLPWGRLSL